MLANLMIHHGCCVPQWNSIDSISIEWTQKKNSQIPTSIQHGVSEKCRIYELVRTEKAMIMAEVQNLYEIMEMKVAKIIVYLY